ncbi:sensor histidine kinase [Flavobacterium sp.]|uniref:sensor histidine kinase n=1 Tax=Flavobacterium sp. TaxID=239 RepID=UPI0039E23155
MPPANHRKKIHLILFIAVIVLQLIVFSLWLGQHNEESKLTQSFEKAQQQNLGFVYSNGATKNYFDAENAFVEYLHNYDLKALTQYRQSLDTMSVYLDSLNKLVKEDRYLWFTVSRKKDKETEIARLRKELDALLKLGVYRLTENTTAEFTLTPYDFKKVLQSITYDSIRVSDEVLKKGMLRRIGDAIVGKYAVRRDELQVYMKMMYGNVKKTGNIEDQMRYIFNSTRTHYTDEFGQLRNTYSNLRERDRELMVINKKILQNSQAILMFYTQSAQQASQLQFADAMTNIHHKKDLMGMMLLVLATFTVLLARYAWSAHRNERQLSEAKKLAESNLEFKSRLMGMLSHEMRAPLNIISNLTNKIKTSNGDKTLNNPINLLHFTSNSLQISVNQILDFSKNEHTELTLHNSRVNLKKEVHSILESLKSLTDVKKIDLVSKIDASLDTKVLADNGKIQQLFYNIIGNAIKFTNKGSITVSCQLTQMENSNRFDVVVKDTGVGIAPADLGKVFDKSFENKQYKQQIGFGDGLGLSLCKEIVELYDGQITVDSEIGQGTEIAFTLFLENPVV